MSLNRMYTASILHCFLRMVDPSRLQNNDKGKSAPDINYPASGGGDEKRQAKLNSCVTLNSYCRAILPLPITPSVGWHPVVLCLMTTSECLVVCTFLCDMCQFHLGLSTISSTSMDSERWCTVLELLIEICYHATLL